MNKARIKRRMVVEDEVVVWGPMEKKDKKKPLFVSFSDCDFHFSLGLGESAVETLFNITQNIIIECTTASPPQFLLNTHSPN